MLASGTLSEDVAVLSCTLTARELSPLALFCLVALPSPCSSTTSFFLQLGGLICWVFLFREPPPCRGFGLEETVFLPGGLPGFLFSVLAGELFTISRGGFIGRGRVC